ncbi:MAG: ATP-binding protein [Halobacteriaceae archaeon]
MEPRSARERLYQAFAAPEREVDRKIRRALELGTAYLDLPIGFFTRVEDGVQEIVHATGDHPLIQPGETCPLEQAYCRRTVEVESPLAVEDAAVSTDVSDTAFETFDLGAYIGARVVVDGAVHGTLCFAAEAERDAPFTRDELYFVELAAGLAGQALERRAHGRELAEREAALDEQAEVYRAVVEASFDLVFRVDASGTYSYLSPATTSLLGYDPAHFEGEHFATMLPGPEVVETAESLFADVLAGETVEAEYFPLAHRSGRTVYVDLRVTPLYEPGVPAEERTAADVVGAVGTARDATDRHRRERLVGVLNRVLRHNLRNDVNVIAGYAETVRDHLSGEVRDYAERIVATADRLAAVSDTARELESTLRSEPEMARRDVVPLVTRPAEQVAERHPEASVTVDAPDAAAAWTAPRLETAVWELVDNAASHGGEHPEVTVEVVDGAPAADGAGGDDGEGTVLVRVTDDGPGLPEQERTVLVAGEETSVVHGSGLGLWLVYWIVQSVEGELRVRDVASGPCIEIRLPEEP